MGYYAASSGNCLLTFGDNLSVPSSRVLTLEDYLLHNNPEESSSILFLPHFKLIIIISIIIITQFPCPALQQIEFTQSF